MITGFVLKRPDDKRRTFQILPYRLVNGKRLYQSPVSEPALKSVNDGVLAGRLSVADAEIEIKTKIIPELRRRASIPDKVIIDSLVSTQNMKVFNDCWAKEYRRKKMEDPKTARAEFMRALAILEPLSLYTCDVDTLQDHWDKKESGTRHKRYGNRINQLLRFLGRGFELRTDRAIVPPLKSVTWDELNSILEYLEEEPLKLLYRSLYGTGARLGEMLAIGPEDVRSNGTIYIHKQLDRYKRIKPYTKNKKSHDTVILNEAIESVKKWAAIPNKVEFRSRCQHPLIEAAKRAFPKDTSKQISPHKLRHSYVKKMLELGVPLHRIAQFLGDNVSTLEAVYRQWVVSDVEVDFVKSIMNEGYKRLKEKKND